MRLELADLREGLAAEFGDEMRRAEARCHLRHAKVIALRDDQSPKDVRRET